MRHPAFIFQGTDDADWVLFMEELLQFVTLAPRAQGRDVPFILGRLVASGRPRLHLPTQTRGQPCSTNQPCRILDKAVVADQPQFAIFDVRNPVERVHQQAKRAVVERNRHGVGGKVALPQVFCNARRLILRLAGLWKRDRKRSRKFKADAARKDQIQGKCSGVLTDHCCAQFLQRFS